MHKVWTTPWNANMSRHWWVQRSQLKMYIFFFFGTYERFYGNQTRLFLRFIGVIRFYITFEFLIIRNHLIFNNIDAYFLFFWIHLPTWILLYFGILVVIKVVLSRKIFRMLNQPTFYVYIIHLNFLPQKLKWEYYLKFWFW